MLTVCQNIRNIGLLGVLIALAFSVSCGADRVSGISENPSSIAATTATAGTGAEAKTASDGDYFWAPNVYMWCDHDQSGWPYDPPTDHCGYSSYVTWWTDDEDFPDPLWVQCVNGRVPIPNSISPGKTVWVVGDYPCLTHFNVYDYWDGAGYNGDYITCTIDYPDAQIRGYQFIP